MMLEHDIRTTTLEAYLQEQALIEHRRRGGNIELAKFIDDYLAETRTAKVVFEGATIMTARAIKEENGTIIAILTDNKSSLYQAVWNEQSELFDVQNEWRGIVMTVPIQEYIVAYQTESTGLESESFKTTAGPIFINLFGAPTRLILDQTVQYFVTATWTHFGNKVGWRQDWVEEKVA